MLPGAGVKRFWQSMQYVILFVIILMLSWLFWRDVVFGLLRDDNAQRKAHACIIDLILLMAE